MTLNTRVVFALKPKLDFRKQYLMCRYLIAFRTFGINIEDKMANYGKMIVINLLQSQIRLTGNLNLQLWWHISANR